MSVLFTCHNLTPVYDSVDRSLHHAQIMHEDIYDGLEAYAKPAKVEHELYAQLKTFNITNILHSQVR